MDEREVVASWSHGVPHGKWEWRDATGKTIAQVEFDEGAIVGPHARLLTARLAEAMAKPESNAAPIRERFFAPVTGTFSDHLRSSANWLSDAMRLPIEGDWDELVPAPIEDRPPDGPFEVVPLSDDTRLLVPIDEAAPPSAIRLEVGPAGGPDSTAKDESKLVPLADLPVEFDVNEMPGIMALVEMLQQHNLVCDYRYGTLWVTTPEIAAVWRDTTGVEQIVPPPGSRLAAEWEKSTELNFIQTPLHDVLSILADVHSISIDASQASSPPLTVEVSGVSLKEGLGRVLYRARCKCSLRGDALVVEDLPAVEK
jgi:hypothetical protein